MRKVLASTEPGSFCCNFCLGIPPKRHRDRCLLILFLFEICFSWCGIVDSSFLSRTIPVQNQKQHVDCRAKSHVNLNCATRLCRSKPCWMSCRAVRWKRPLAMVKWFFRGWFRCELVWKKSLPSGKTNNCYGKLPFLMGLSTINGPFR